MKSATKVMRRRRRLGYCSNVESRRRCMVDMNPTDYDECYFLSQELNVKLFGLPYK